MHELKYPIKPKEDPKEDPNKFRGLPLFQSVSCKRYGEGWWLEVDVYKEELKNYTNTNDLFKH